MTLIAAPLNIYSGETGLGAALTNPTELARAKGKLAQPYQVRFRGPAGILFPDAESAYQHFKRDFEAPEQRDRMMTEVICVKFQTHLRLAHAVQARGGADWLSTCSHLTGARSPSAQAWEGAGLESRFIRNLVAGWRLFEAALPAPDERQLSLL